MSADVSPTATHWGNYRVRAEHGRVTEVLPVSEDPDPSPIGQGIPAALYDRARLTFPVARRAWLEGEHPDRRTRGSAPFVRLSWDEALDLVARELDEVKQSHGSEAIFGGSYGWGSAGRFHHPQSQLHRFLNGFGGYTRSVNSYSHGAMEVIMPYVVGGSPTSVLTRSPLWEEIASDGKLVVAFGGASLKNAQSNAGGVGRHTAEEHQLRAKARGVSFVNVSPIRSDLDARLDGEWLAIRPNTDVAVMLGLGHTLLTEELLDRDFLARCCVGFDQLAAYLLGEPDQTPKTAEWAAAIADTDADTIRTLARRIASQRTVIAASWSLQRSDHGEQSHWMATALAAMSGSMGRPGGGLAIGLSAMNSSGSVRGRHRIASLPQGRNPISTFIPVSRITDMLLEPETEIDYDGRRIRLPRIELIYWCGGNPFHHQQDLNRLARAWQRPRTVVVHDAWWTPVARFADIVLPIATALEREDFAAGQNDLTVAAMCQAAEPPGEARTDFAAFAALAKRLGFEASFTEGRSEREWVHHLYEQTRSGLAEGGFELPALEELQRLGAVQTPGLDQTPAGDFARLRADPVRYPLQTPSGRIEIYSQAIASFGYDDCPPHPTWIEPAEWLGGAQAQRYPLHLLSNQPRTRLHSQYDNGAASLDSKVSGREPVSLHPDDASARCIADGDIVRIFNDRGSCLAGAVISDTLRQGVVQLSTGAWYDPELAGDPAVPERHGNPNVLTLDKGTSRLAQACSANTCLVEVERWSQVAASVQAFEPPEIQVL